MQSPIYLISLSDFAPFRDITTNVAIERLQPYILEAQKYDLKPLLGDEMYFDFILNYTSNQKYIDLLNGKQYADLVGNQIIYEGCKTLIAYYSYARFIQNQGTVTQYGFVYKNVSSESTTIKGEDLSTKVAAAQACAFSESIMMERFIRDNILNYPLYVYWRRKKAGKGININAVGGFKDPNTVRNLNQPFRDHDGRYDY